MSDLLYTRYYTLKNNSAANENIIFKEGMCVSPYFKCISINMNTCTHRM